MVVLRVLYKIYFAIVFMAIGVVLYPLIWVLTKTKMTKALYAVKVNLWWPLLQVFLGYPVRSIRPKNFSFPKGPFVVVANHQSYLDIMSMYTILYGHIFFFLGKDSLRKFPIIGLFFRAPHLHVPVKRENKTEASQSLKEISSRLDAGFPIIIFPEGTQSKKAPEMNAFKAGAFKVAIEKKVPIVPICFPNNYKFLSLINKANGPARPGLIQAIIHEPIDTSSLSMDDLVSLQERVYALLEADLKNYHPEHFKS